MEYYSAIKNAFESVLMRWINLEPILQSEVSQKNTNMVYQRIWYMVYGIYKYGNDDTICGTAKETQM